MNTLSFEHPVSIFELGFPCRIKSIPAAITYLEDMAPIQRCEAWQATMAACIEARDGRIPVAEARDVFEAFTRRRNTHLDMVA